MNNYRRSFFLKKIADEAKPAGEVKPLNMADIPGGPVGKSEEQSASTSPDSSPKKIVTYITNDITGEKYLLNSPAGQKLKNGGGDVSIDNGEEGEEIDGPGRNQTVGGSGVRHSDTELQSSEQQQSSKPVIDMQNAIIAFAKELANHQLLDDKQTSDEHDQHKIEGSNPFMNFLVTNYMNKESKRGQTFVNVDNAPTSTATENVNYKAVLASLQRIGSQGATKPDGLWGERTSTALQNIYALAKTFLNFETDMGESGLKKIYTTSDLTTLNNNTPQNAKEPVTDKDVKATALTQNIMKLKNMYQEFNKKFLAENQEIISQRQPLVSISTKSAPPADPKVLDDFKDIKLHTNIDRTPKDITVQDLSSTNNFKTYLKNEGFENDSIAQDTILIRYLQGIKNGLQRGEVF